MAVPTVITILHGTLKVGTTAPAATAADCQIVSARLTAQAKLNTIAATFCSPESQAAAASGYQLEITALQDWTVALGFSQFAFANDGKLIYWELTLDPDTTPSPKAQMHGQAYAVAMDFGGDAGVPLDASTTWPVLGKPVAGPSVLILEADVESGDAATAA